MGAGLQKGDRIYVVKLWAQNQHVPHLLPTINPHIAQFHIFSTGCPLKKQHLTNKVPTYPHILLKHPTQKSTSLAGPTSQRVVNGQNVGRMLSGDNVEKMLI